ncbi:glycoside hydrolase family 13 protein [Scleromatobacter humisilvae]|uniref:Glycoside hydrolase family 13 protein n=1 Tax=Scleromatobacter humisilvae TaxID=2897159 RepID=A0A9X1YKA0_9BURK|nr:glycoside hydrolase family 13 protein [Scleromatobacter humisilvae]MCK9686455.1 glycoside hydrolase family 13 protein [Scleromatobacter humisilvae]
MKSHRLAASALLLAAATQAFAADCHPDPLPGRSIYLRGSFNDWRADDETALSYVCDHYELVARLSGAQSFKVGDEDWDFDFGAPGDITLNSGVPVALAAKGQALKATFNGVARISLTPGPAPTLTVTDLPADTPLPPPAASTVTDPVALSLAFDSQDVADKSPYGAVVVGTEVTFSLSALPGVDAVTLVVEKRRLEGNYDVLDYSELARVPLARAPAGADGRERWSGRYRFDAAAVYGYWFEAKIGGRTVLFENNPTPVYWTRERGAGGAGVVAEMPSNAKRIRRYRQTVYTPYTVPAWASDAVYYYIFPERFRNGDRRNDPRPGVDRFHDKTVEFHEHWNDKPWRPGSGDGSDDQWSNDFFGGDIAGIIQKLDYIRSVGANTLYITPMFTAASNHKYDTADWKHIDPHFGTNADFERLCREAAKRGIRVLPDASLNHSGADSIYFDRYGTRGGQGAFEGGRINAASPYASWYTFDATQAEPDKQFKGWVGVADLPELNKADPSYRAFAYGAPDSVTRTWLNAGASGWRMDVAPWVPDDFWREWRAVVKQTKPDALTVSETWFDASKFFLGDEFDSTMNYIFRDAVLDYANGGDARRMVANLEEIREAYPPQTFAALMNLLSTHDSARSLHVLGDVDGKATPAEVALAKQKLRLAVFFQMTYPGSPAIFYGDEVGVTGGPDPMNRGTYPWADRGGHPDNALLADFRRLTKLRHDLPVLRHGQLMAPLHVDEHVVVLARRDANTVAITATNNGDAARTLTVPVPRGASPFPWTDALSHVPAQVDIAARTLTIVVPARSGVVLLARASHVPKRADAAMRDSQP